MHKAHGPELAPSRAPRAEMALDFMKIKRRNKQHCKAWTKERLLHHFNDVSVADKGDLTDPESAVWGRFLHTAMSWLHDHGLRDWVTKQNMEKGVAPANEHV